MRGVGRREERALMMIKPPGDAGRIRILEIDDHIFIAVEYAVVERLTRAVSHARQPELAVRIHAFAIKSRKNSGGRGSIEAPVMKAQADSYGISHGHAPSASKSQLTWT